MIGPGENPAPYLRWANERPEAAIDLAGSNLLAVTPAELPGLFDGVDYTGANSDGWPPLREAIGRYHALAADRVALATGTSGANFLAMAALAAPGDEVLVESPVYDPFPAIPRLLGAEVRFVERRFEEGWRLDPVRVEAAMTPRTRLVVLSSPHNPTGVRSTAEELVAIAEAAARRGAVVLVDEVYAPADPAPRPAAALHPALVTTGSLTKSQGLAGLRCGWVLATPEIVARAIRTRDLVDGSGSYPAEVAAVRAFEAMPMLAARARRILEPNRSAVAAFVASRPELDWVPPEGGSVAFLRLRGVADAAPFARRLFAERGVAVVPGRFFGAPGFVRVAFGGAAEPLVRGLALLGEALDAGWHRRA